MKKKKYLIGAFILIIGIALFSGLIKINIINTKALSPIGNTYDNFKMVSAEFGEDFSKFIQDRSNVKIYEEENGDYILNIDDNNIRVKEESKLLNGIKIIFGKIGEGIEYLLTTVENLFYKIILN